MENVLSISPRLDTALLKPSEPDGSTTAPATESGQDAALIAACKAFDQLERLQQNVGTTRLPPEDEATEAKEYRSRLRQQAELLRSILSLQATTLAGVRAKAATLFLWDGDLGRKDETYWNVMLVRSLVSDVLLIGTDRI